MSCSNFEELKKHIGHDITCVKYGKMTIGKNGYIAIQEKDIENVAIECNTCNEVILDFNR